MPIKPELLSPAGDKEKLAVALAYGADAVYLAGKTFGLRAGAGNFSLDEMRDAMALIHDSNRLGYITVNIFGHPRDFTHLDAELLHYQDIGADALIVSDPGIFRRCRQIIPQMPIHISTQANVTNAESCRFWYEQGASRVVLARELTFEEIKAIRRDTPKELSLECFIHGAMCMSYSGRCLLSNHFTGRGANQGACAQPCRWKYQVKEENTLLYSDVEICEEKRPTDPLYADEDERGTYLFNSEDMCMIDQIPDLIAAGIDSFKIEGRIKGSFYVASTTWAYRNAIDAYINQPDRYQSLPEWKEQLERTVHRSFGTGFYYDRPIDTPHVFPEETYIRSAFVTGIVTGYDADSQLLQISQRNKMHQGAILTVLQPNGKRYTLQVTQILDENKKEVESTPRAQNTYYLRCDREIPNYSFLSMDGDKDSRTSL